MWSKGSTVLFYMLISSCLSIISLADYSYPPNPHPMLNCSASSPKVTRLYFWTLNFIPLIDLFIQVLHNLTVSSQQNWKQMWILNYFLISTNISAVLVLSISLWILGSACISKKKKSKAILFKLIEKCIIINQVRQILKLHGWLCNSKLYFLCVFWKFFLSLSSYFFSFVPSDSYLSAFQSENCNETVIKTICY